MEIVIKKLVLQSALDKAFAVAAKSSTNPALLHVLAEVSADNLKLIGSDGELSIVTSCDQLTVVEPGTVLLGPSVHDIIKLCDVADIHIRADERTIFIDCAEAHFEVMREMLDYPRVNEAHHSPVIVPKDVLQSAIQKCRPAIASETMRQMYAFLQIKDGKILATDGSKCHETSFDYPIDALIPSRAIVDILRRIRSTALDTVSVGHTAHTYTFRFDSDLLIATRHNVDYPDVQTHILAPASFNSQCLKMEKKRFVDAVKRVSQTADDDTNYLTLDIAPGKLVLVSFDKYGNNSYETLEAEWAAAPRKVGVNYLHLLDVLSVYDEPDVRVYLGEDEPNKLSTLRFEQDGFIGVLIQLRSDLGMAAVGADRGRSTIQKPSDDEVRIGSVL